MGNASSTRVWQYNKTNIYIYILQVFHHHEFGLYKPQVFHLFWWKKQWLTHHFCCLNLRLFTAAARWTTCRQRSGCKHRQRRRLWHLGRKVGWSYVYIHHVSIICVNIHVWLWKYVCVWHVYIYILLHLIKHIYIYTYSICIYTYHAYIYIYYTICHIGGIPLIITGL
jgi:hypothetical protein